MSTPALLASARLLRPAVVVVLALAAANAADDYFPPPDSSAPSSSRGGWRAIEDAATARRVAGIDRARLDDTFDFIQRTSKHGGLLVARRGWLVYERYFGRAHRHANANSASVGGVARDAFWKPGSGGHCIYVVPSLDLVAFKMGGRDDQYDPANTGVPLDPSFHYDGSREGWHESAGGADQWTETLRLIVRSVVN